jgi:hypothetical protein
VRGPRQIERYQRADAAASLAGLASFCENHNGIRPMPQAKRPLRDQNLMRITFVLTSN